MKMIEWDSSLSVNVEEIDRQHQKLIGVINDLFDAMTEGKGKTVLGKIVRELVNYTEIHFKTEEMYFEKFGYPATEAHRLQHAEFIKKVSSFDEGFKRGQLGLSGEIMNFLGSWLKEHIMKTDRQYSKCFNENGLR